MSLATRHEAFRSCLPVASAQTLRTKALCSLCISRCGRSQIVGVCQCRACASAQLGGLAFGIATDFRSILACSGALACAATSADFSGTNQYQTVSITEPSGVKLWKPQVTVAGTGGNPYTVWVRAVLDSYIQSTT